MTRGPFDPAGSVADRTTVPQGPIRRRHPNVPFDLPRLNDRLEAQLKTTVPGEGMYETRSELTPRDLVEQQREVNNPTRHVRLQRHEKEATPIPQVLAAARNSPEPVSFSRLFRLKL